MEFFTLLLSTLLGVVSPVGTVADRVAETAIRNQLDRAEQLAVRIDNIPSYRLAQGRVDRVRIAGRGIYPIADVRLAAVEIETDAIALDPGSLGDRPQLEAPLQAGVKLVLNREDLQRALQSEAIAARIRNLNLNFPGASTSQSQQYKLIDPYLEFLPNNRFRLQVTLKEEISGNTNQIKAEAGVQLIGGRKFQFVEPMVQVNDSPLPPQLIGLLTGGLSQYLDLARLEPSGITTRILKLESHGDDLTIAAFVQLDPKVLLAAPPPPLAGEFLGQSAGQ
jgi:hypothetical protein